ncbi:MAG: hypothetical protein AAGA87_07545 [Pseudomonadota bacterium]
MSDWSGVSTVSGSEHVKWGFFLGDAPVGGTRSHTHMATFVSGDRITSGMYDTAGKLRLGGTAEYNGHAIGTVVDAGGSRLAAGTYRDTFNFDTRTGTFELGFDGRDYSGPSTGDFREGVGALYSGSTEAPAGSAPSDFAATVAGEFVHNGGSVASVTQPSGLIGSFDIGGPSYSATGTFGAVR